MVNDIVYAGGSFTSVRPAGPAAGANETPRSNLKPRIVGSSSYVLDTKVPAKGAVTVTLARNVNGADSSLQTQDGDPVELHAPIVASFSNLSAAPTANCSTVEYHRPAPAARVGLIADRS